MGALLVVVVAGLLGDGGRGDPDGPFGDVNKHVGGRVARSIPRTGVLGYSLLYAPAGPAR
jgi:hypothetical protein